VEWGGEWKEKGKTTLIGQDKGSSREQQTKKILKIILIRRIYKTKSEMDRVSLTTRCPAHS